MLFRSKKLSDLQEQDLQRLVNDQVQERDTVEYKRDMYGNSDDDKREMLRDITSMANHHGGYIVVGIEEDEEGIPTRIDGIEAGNHIERITNSCLDNIDRRIVGLGVEDISLSNGRVVIVISIPESINAPHMVTYKGLNQFWKRHGRQKDKMTIDEIGEAFDKRLSNLNRLDRFLFTRKAQILENIGNQTQMVISASPTFMRDEVIFDNQDNNLHQMILNPPRQLPRGRISCGQPYPTINGLRADQSTPYYNNPSFDEYIEVFSNGYIEFGKLIENEHGIYISNGVEIPLIVNFMRFIESVYEQYLPLTPLVVSLSILNAKGIWLAVSGHSTEDSRVKWQEQHLELGKFYADNISEERKMLTKAICDRLYQAFNRDRCNLFDGAGTFRLE
ncbi:hypothetical protein ES704_02181 [subsurface metagenome]